MARTVKTKQRTIVYGETPLETRKSQFEKMALSSGNDLRTYARNILVKSWNEKLNLIRQEFSCDKQVVKLLEKAEADYRDQEREAGVRQLSYNNLSLPHTHGKRNRQLAKENRSVFIVEKSDVSAPLKDETHFYSSDEEDDDHLLAAAFKLDEKEGDKSKDLDLPLNQKFASVQSDRCIIAKPPEPKIAFTQIVKPAPPGQFYKKKVFCDNEIVCDTSSRKNKTSLDVSKSTPSSSAKRRWEALEEDLSIDSIFRPEDEIKPKNVPSDKLKNNPDQHVKASKSSYVDISIDDIFD